MPAMLLLWGFAVDFNFFAANPQMFAVRNRFANVRYLRICGPIFGSAQPWLMVKALHCPF